MAEEMILPFEDTIVREEKSAKKIKFKPESYEEILDKFTKVQKQNNKVVEMPFADSNEISSRELNNTQDNSKIFIKISNIENKCNINFIDENIANNYQADSRAIKINPMMMNNITSTALAFSKMSNPVPSFIQESVRLEENLKNIEITKEELEENELENEMSSNIDTNLFANNINRAFVNQHEENIMNSYDDFQQVTNSYQGEQTPSEEETENYYEEYTEDENIDFNNFVTPLEQVTDTSEVRKIDKVPSFSQLFNNINNDIFGNAEEDIEMPSIAEKSDIEEEKFAMREEPVVVNDRESFMAANNVEEKKSNLSFNFDNATFNNIKRTFENSKIKNVQAIKDRVNILQKQSMEIEQKVKAAEKQEQETDMKYQEMVEKLSKYGDQLEEECNAKLQLAQEKEAANNMKNQEINSMLEVMGIVDEPVSKGMR